MRFCPFGSCVVSNLHAPGCMSCHDRCRRFHAKALRLSLALLPVGGLFALHLSSTALPSGQSSSGVDCLQVAQSVKGAQLGSCAQPQPSACAEEASQAQTQTPPQPRQFFRHTQHSASSRRLASACAGASDCAQAANWTVKAAGGSNRCRRLAGDVTRSQAAAQSVCSSARHHG